MGENHEGVLVDNRGRCGTGGDTHQRDMAVAGRRRHGGVPRCRLLGQSSRRHLTVAVVAVALLALPGCDIFDLGAVRGDQVHAPAAAGLGAVVHDGGNIGDDCVFDVMIGGGTAVMMAIAPAPTAIGVVLSWSLFGASTFATIENCLITFDAIVAPDMLSRGIATYCAFRYNVGHYTNCVLAKWALWSEVQAVNQVIAAGLILGWTAL